jgi:hypothetical protein
VWFAIVAPANEFLTLRITPGTMTDPAMALYSASACGGAMTLMQCDDNLGLGNEPFLTFTPGNLVAGQTYYLRVWNATGSQGTFNLCAFTTGASCFVALRLFDDGNNGWGGSRVTVQVGAAPAVNYTLTTEGANIFYIPFTAGQLIQVSYATMGAPNQGQIYYFLQIGSGILFSGGPNPAAGLVYAALTILWVHTSARQRLFRWRPALYRNVVHRQSVQHGHHRRPQFPDPRLLGSG